MNNSDEIKKVENEILKLGEKLAFLQKENTPIEVKNYVFKTLTGAVTLRDLFSDHDELVVIHNMGQGCAYCTLWGDGLSPFLPHLESTMSVVMVSKDSPVIQRQFANSRQWRFNMVSHGGGEYMHEQAAGPGEVNMPGIAVYEKSKDKILKKNMSYFGPGDLFCSLWPILSLAGVAESNWAPQYNYWKQPKGMGSDEQSSDV